MAVMGHFIIMRPQARSQENSCGGHLNESVDRAGFHGHAPLKLLNPFTADPVKALHFAILV